MPRFRAPGKPQYGASIDPAHPLAGALSRAWLFANEGTPRELTRGVAGTLVGSATLSPTAEGLALAANGGGGDSLDTGFGGTNTASGTIVWRVYPAFSPTDGAIHQFWGHYTGAGVPEFGAQKYSDNNWYVGWNTAGGDRRVSIAATTGNLAQNAWQTYALAWGPGGSTFYRNGVVLGTNGSALTVGDVSAVSFVIGNRNDNGSISSTLGLPSGSATAFVYLFNRALTGPEVVAVSADPYAFLQPRRRVVKAPSGAATYTLSGGGTLPVPVGSGTGLTNTNPVYTLSGSGTLPVPAGSGTGLTNTAPVYTLSGGGAVPVPVGSGTGLTFTVPVYTLSGSGTLPAPSGSGTGLTYKSASILSGAGTLPVPTGSGTGLTFAPPVYTLSGSATLPAPTGSGTGLTYVSASILSGGATVPVPSGSGTGFAVTNPSYTLSGGGTVPVPSGSGAGLQFANAIYSLSGNATVPGPSGSGTGLTFAVPVSTLSGTGTVGAPAGSGSGLTFVAPVYTLTGNGTLAVPVGSGAGFVITNPAYTLSGTATLAAPSGSGVGLTFALGVPQVPGRVSLSASVVGGATVGATRVGGTLTITTGE